MWVWIPLLVLAVSEAWADGAPVYRVNCGGAAYSGNADGTAPSTGQTRLWMADTFYISGRSTQAPNDTNLAKIKPLYRTERWSENAAPMSYSFPVAADAYVVRLHFAEFYGPFMTVGKRVFHVSLNGKRVLENFDIFAAAGAYAGIAKEFQVTVTNGKIDIAFDNVAGNAKISAIEILKKPLTPATQPPYRINCGAVDDYYDPDGLAWEPDSHFEGGMAMGFATLVTTSNEIFRTERFNHPTSPGYLRYSFAAPAGSYKVMLYFVEGFSGVQNAGERIFHVAINDKVVLDSFDIVAEFGYATAVVQEFDITTDGSPLVIRFTNVVQSAKINGIEILPLATALRRAARRPFQRPTLPHGRARPGRPDLVPWALPGTSPAHPHRSLRLDGRTIPSPTVPSP